MGFDFFDSDAPVGVTRRNLPHWFQPGATYFVTFRTADSLPNSVIERWQGTRRQWLSTRGIDFDDPGWESRLRQLPGDDQIAFTRKFNAMFHTLLDAGHGECPLRQPELGGIVAAAFHHFDQQRYRLSDFVVMPNHVHVLLGLIGDNALSAVCYSWKKYTANLINRRLGRKGHFWQGESFDHIVRSPEQFEYLQSYISANPQKAGLKSGEFVHYQANDSHAEERP